MTLRGSWGFGFGLALLAVSFSARAEEPAATAPAPSSGAAADPAPDVVRLKNGGMLRGRISELIPGESVTIVTVAGKTREVAMSEVDYAGPAAKDPQAALPPSASAPARASTPPQPSDSPVAGGGEGKAKAYVTVHGKEARLHVVSAEEGITFHRQASSAVAVGSSGGSAFATGYERICTAPCDVSLPAGTETLALSRDGKPPIVAGPITLPPGKSELSGTFESRAGLRAAGWVLMIGGGLAGLVVMATSSTTEKNCSAGTSYCYDTPSVSSGQLIGGSVLMGASIGAGIFMVRTPDKALVEVTPTNAALSRPLGIARGLSISGRF